MDAKQREDLFWNNVNILNETNTCWEWKLSVDRYGYGKVKMFGKVVIAHRVAYELWYRIKPGRLHVLHTCDNPKCCNPFHLWLGTHLDNVRDMDRKGRRNLVFVCNKKISYEIAEEIRNRCKSGESKSSLARLFGVSTRNIRDIVNYVIWKRPPTANLSPLVAPDATDGRKTGENGGVAACKCARFGDRTEHGILKIVVE